MVENASTWIKSHNINVFAQMDSLVTTARQVHMPDALYSLNNQSINDQVVISSTAVCDTISCQNGGTCNPVKGTCDCPTGTTGQFCEINICNPTPCQNGGACVPTDGGVFTCSCPLGFTGDLCENAVCTATTCLNGGLCTPLASGDFTCTCPVGFSGDRCEVDVCNPSPCMNGGTCIRTATGASCDCSTAPGFTGALCNQGRMISLQASEMRLCDVYNVLPVDQKSPRRPAQARLTSP